MIDDIILKLGTMDDADAIFALLQDFAKQQAVEDEFKLTKDRLLHLMDRHQLQVLLAKKDGKIIGFITFYEIIHTFSGITGLHIEDMYIRNSYQRQGVGQLLLDGMINETKVRGYKILEWQCPSWNKGAINFYTNMGGKIVENLKTFVFEIE